MSEERPDGRYTQLELIRQEEKAFQKFAALRLANDDKVSIPKIYFDITGDFAAAAVLDEIMFWTLPNKRTGRTALRVRKEGILWLAVSRPEWWDRKRVTERQADRAIELLIEKGLIEKSIHRFNGHAQTHLRVKAQNFFEAYGKALQENYMTGDDADDEPMKEIDDLYALMGMGGIISDSPNRDSRNGDTDSPNRDTDSPNRDTLNSLQPASNQPPELTANSKKSKRTLPEGLPQPTGDLVGDWLKMDAGLKAKNEPMNSAIEALAKWPYNFPHLGENKAFDRVAKLIAADGRNVQQFVTWAKMKKRDPHWYLVNPDSLWGDWPQAFTVTPEQQTFKPDPDEGKYVPAPEGL